MKKLVISVAIVVSLIVGGAVLLPQEAECYGNDCPPYNTPCYSNYTCGYNCGMTCVAISYFNKRCR